MDKIYNITEMFLTVQGEGFHTGRKALFIRFADCNMACNFCDTDFSYSDYNFTLQQLLEKIQEFQDNAETPFHHIVLTGGEPLMQVDEALMKRLVGSVYFVQIETNGTMPAPFMNSPMIPASSVYITCSPKKKAIHPCLLPFISEMKIVLFDRSFVEHILDTYGRYGAWGNVRGVGSPGNTYIQPCEKGGVMDVNAVQKFIMGRKEDLRMSIQTQKIGNFE